MVEAQYLASTAKIVDTRAEQELLEDILEERKPPIPQEAASLHYLLFSPFRYETRHPSGSRFRAVSDPGVFYAAETVRTAAAEVGYWRWRFLQDTTGLERLQPCSFTRRSGDRHGMPASAQSCINQCVTRKSTSAQPY